MPAPLPLSIQLYTLRDRIQEKGFLNVLRELSFIGLPYVEFAGFHGLSPASVKRILDDEGLKASSAHVPVFAPAKWNEIEDEAKRVGYKHVIAGFGADDFKTEDAVKAAAEKANTAVNHFRSRDLIVSYHNHEWEFTDPDKAALFFDLCPHLGLQIDIYWVQTANQNPAEWIRRYARRTHLLHIKDGPADPKNRNAPMTAAGKGRVPIADCVRAAENTGVEFLALELDQCETDMLSAVRECTQFMIRHGLGSGRI